MKLGIIGFGRMGSALLYGILKGKIIKANEVQIYDTSKESAKESAKEILKKEKKIQIASSLKEIFENCEALLLCVKPDKIPEILKSIPKQNSSLLISIAAGITLAQLEKLAPKQTRIVRAMPNTPFLVNEGACAFSLGKTATEKDKKTVKDILSPCGLVLEIGEKQMNAVIGVSGSGPAYIYMLIEALADGGVKMGLPRKEAIQLATQTVYGAAEMVKQTGKHPAELKDMVCSPAGTTIAAVSHLENKNFRASCIQAVEIAAKRASEMEKL